MGPGFTVRNGGNVSKDGPGDKYQEFQDHGMHARVHMGEVWRTCVKEANNGRRSNVSGAEKIAGKLRIIRRAGGTIRSKAAHDKPTWTMCPPEEGGW